MHPSQHQRWKESWEALIKSDHCATHLIVAIAFFTTVKIFSQSSSMVFLSVRKIQKILVIIFTISVMHYTQNYRAHLWEIFLFGLKHINLLLVRPFEVRRHMSLIGMLSLESTGPCSSRDQENTPLICATPSVESQYKDRKKDTFFALFSLCKHIHLFIGMRANFFRIPTYTEDQLRHQVFWDRETTRFLDFL